MNKQNVVLGAICLSLALSACESESLSGRVVKKTTEIPGMPDEGRGAWLCAENADCPFGMICKNNLCVHEVINPQDQGCTEDSDCPEGYRCATTTGQCVPEADFPNWPTVPTSTCSEGEFRSCGSKVGTCEYGVQTCVMGAWDEECLGELGPEPERCDDLDNDCDSETDEDYVLGVSCVRGIGACQEWGATICASTGTTTECSVSGLNPTGRDELCGNGIDDDCNGQTDEGYALNIACTVGTGVCERSGVTICDSSRLGTVCSAMAGMPGAAELCGNGTDDNCDGVVDEGFADLGMSCTVGTGACERSGVNVCSSNQLTTRCSVTPGMPAVAELCGNNIDDNCDGVVDEGFPNVGGNCMVGTGACERSGTTICSADGLSEQCSVTPGTPAVAELCGNNVDDNCDGQTDEGFAMLGASCSVGQGTCTATGALACSPNQLSLVCDQVPGAANAQGELCGNMLDDDCDGQTDEGYPLLGTVCSVGVGVCQQNGTNLCTADRLSTACNATAGVPNTQGELCGNMLDDDCDGQTDEGYTVGAACAVGEGICRRTGMEICAPSGTQTICNASAGSPNAQGELCGNGFDDDCDGQVDEGFALNVPCTAGIGGCERSGVTVCSTDGLSAVCSASAGMPAVAELCGNNVDDDCDGQTDEGFSTVGNACSAGVGACEQNGVVVCSANQLATQCSVSGGTAGANELCGNNIDDDCDGQIDEGFALNLACSVGMGICERSGVTVCSNNRLSAVCSASAGTPAAAELCGNNADDDCDGQTDEGFANVGNACSDGVGACLRNGAIICTANQLSTQCSVSAGTPGPNELCGNNVDDNCNGQIDEGYANVGNTCSDGVGACERSGNIICSANQLSTLCSVSAGTPGPIELCGNNVDDNCDGLIDEGFATLGTSCLVGTAPCQATGTLVCSTSLTALECDLPPAGVEICNGLDDDNDTCIDEDFDVGAACSAGIGVCAQSGMKQCVATGTTTECSVSALPPGPNELCGNTLDDDCDGQTDEGYSDVGTACNVGVGICNQSGVMVCASSLLMTECGAVASAPNPLGELCGNTFDDDCDGQTDEGFALNVPCSSGVGACERNGATVCSGDRLTTICGAAAGMPGANELCGNNIDDNCDGQTDEGFANVGLSCTAGVGACAETGVVMCTPNQLGTQCSVSGGTPGASELCGNNVDDNCNGQTDEGFSNLGNACTAGQGICQRSGAMICTSNLLSTACDAVAGSANAQGELCGNNLDDDCDGQVDEGYANLGASCTVGVGSCERTGVFICSGDQLGTVCSVSAGSPGAAELCGNNIDDDCDGQVDEGFAAVGTACSAGVGACEQNGNIICSANLLGTLCSVSGGTPGANELCGNNTDDDCDGQIDEGYSVGVSCSAGIGICEQTGSTVCAANLLSTVCSASAGMPGANELCGNNLDDDCDGQTDEGFPTVGNTCTNGVGQCEGSGNIVCSANRLSTECNATAGTANPLGELCGNNTDDDCDGQTDEGYNVGVACSDGQGICQQNGNLVCTTDRLGTECNVSAGTPNAQGELCGNSLDDDCDGQVDEGYPTVGNACADGQGICLRRGAVTCSTDRLSVVCDAVAGPPNALGELCGNSLDDDCDGQFDEGFPDLGTGCTAGQGVCEQSGVYVCSGNLTQTVCSATAGTPGADELCGNGLDDNCNGQVDEGFPDLGNACTNGQGICEGRGRYVCTANQLATRCNAVMRLPNPLGELCGNRLDDDCDGQTDEGFTNLGDACTAGVGVCLASGQIVCSGSGLTTECNATPGLAVRELCDDLDNDCNGVADNGCDDDGDDYCDANLVLLGQPAVCPNTLNPALLDCNDANFAINPGAMEICNDTVDQDCDGDPNNGCAPCDPTVDADFAGSNECDDCDDTNGAVFPGAIEDCDGLDNDCDMAIDENYDRDMDTYTTCGTLPAGGLDPAYIDCDDTDMTRHPFACELCALGSTANTVACGTMNDRGNAVDEDCDGYLDETCSPCDTTDPDNDGVSECDGDCAPNNPSVAPGLPEICDGFDNDCNTTTVENCVVGDPCNWSGAPPSDVCASGLLCVESLGTNGMPTGSFSCTSLCNFSGSGMGIGDGCAANQICDSALTPTANLHGCAVSMAFGTAAVGSPCTTDNQCRSGTCINDTRQTGTPLRYCADYCGSNDYCGGGTTCQVWGSDTGLCLTTLSTQNRGVGVSCSDTTLRCEGGPRTCIQFRPGGFICSEACCTNSNCPSGYYCAAWGNASIGPIGGVDTVPVCWPEMSTGAHNRQAGASCTSNNECTSEFCDRTLGVCVDLCCNNSTCPNGLGCNQAIITRPDGAQTYARVCTSLTPANPLEPMP